MKKASYLLFFAALQFASAQSAQDEIDKDVWIPFTRAWESNDGEAYNSVHSDDVWRINPGRLLVGDEYKSRNLDRMKKQESKRIIELSFETRTTNGHSAYEVGYYRITDRSGPMPKYHVGRFHVALRKQDGKWKITQDWDTDTINDIEITSRSLANRVFTHFQ